MKIGDAASFVLGNAPAWGLDFVPGDSSSHLRHRQTRIVPYRSESDYHVEPANDIRLAIYARSPPGNICAILEQRFRGPAHLGCKVVATDRCHIEVDGPSSKNVE